MEADAHADAAVTVHWKLRTHCATRAVRQRLAWLLLLFVMQGIAAPAASAQFEIPPTIRRLMDKAQSGKELTAAEQKVLSDWGAAASKQGGKDQAARRPDVARLAPTSGCPRKSDVRGIPESAPTKNAYLAMLKAVAPFYGAMAGKARVSIDAALRLERRDGAGADMGAALLMSGAGSAAAYATTWSASRRPDDALAANNLGVVLTGMRDFPRAVAVLLYADALKPNTALILTDIGWAHYNMGNLAKARPFFEKAARVAAAFTAAQLGLGLVAECQGNHAAAVGFLRKALAEQYSATGAAALKRAQGAVAAARPGGRPAPSTPIAAEQADATGLDLPVPPISDLTVRTAAAEDAVARLDGELADRINPLLARKKVLAGIVAKQIAKSMEAPDRSVVLPRDFATELFLFEDVSTSLFGENGPVAAGLRESEARAVAVEQEGNNTLPDVVKDSETQSKLMREAEACGANGECMKAVNYKLQQLFQKGCLLRKRTLDYQYSNQFKGWMAYWDAVKSASRDYYALTAPLLDKVYPPTLHDLLATERELVILTSYQTAVKMGASLPALANQYQSLECIPPEPPQPPDDTRVPTIGKRQPPPCPFKQPLNLSVAIVSFTLDCESAKLEGGEGLLLSLKRDFIRHETTMGVGVGAQVGGPGLSGGAKVMVQVTTDGQNVTDVALGSSVAASAGFMATANAELGAQYSLRGGPEISADASTTLTVGGLTVVP